ncbi:MAG TPA: ABC transporter permease, partial [Plasticicumulans sp.]|nr:ABC transporter permease [Plasticicumulans sp.]
ASQVACGLAITMLGSGLSAYAGRDYVSRTLDGMALIPLGGGFGFDPLIVTGLLLTVLVWYFLQRSRAGLVLRAVGESPATAHALGLPVRRIRWAAVLFGGACAGLAGAYLAIDYTPMWVEGLSAGRGWIALALVVFAGWRPGRTLLGAWLYGGVGILQFHAQALGIAVPAQFLGMLPYLATIVVLTLIARDPLTQRRHTPASLGQPWHPHA